MDVFFRNKELLNLLGIYLTLKRLKMVKIGLERQKIAVFDLKNFLRICYLGFDIIQDCANDKYFDPKVAAWILKPGENEMILSTLVMTYRPGKVMLQEPQFKKPEKNFSTINQSASAAAIQLCSQ